MHKRIGVSLLISDPFSEESMLGISSMLCILFCSPNVVFCGATLELYGFKGSSIVVSSLPGIPNKCFCQAQGPLLVNSWISLRNVKRGPCYSVCNGLGHHIPFFELKTAN